MFFPAAHDPLDLCYVNRFPEAASDFVESGHLLDKYGAIENLSGALAHVLRAFCGFLLPCVP